jgi:thiol:disulfide interchange protein DsbC
MNPVNRASQADGGVRRTSDQMAENCVSRYRHRISSSCSATPRIPNRAGYLQDFVNQMKSLLLLTVLLSIPAVSTADEFTQLREVLTLRLPDITVGEIRKLPELELYEVQGNGINVFYVDARGEYAVFGNLVDLKTRANLTEARRKILLQVDFKELPLDLAFVRVKGDGSRKLAIFSDPDCPYCKQLEQELAGVTDVTIYTFLYPLADLHPDAPRKSRLIWCAPDRSTAWDEAMSIGREPPAAESGCDAPIRSIAETARKLWLTGTPGLIFGNGQMVPGLIPRDQIESMLGASGG